MCPPLAGVFVTASATREAYLFVNCVLFDLAYFSGIVKILLELFHHPIY